MDTDTSSQRQGVASDPLPSWNEGDAKRAILDFVARTTDASGDDYLEPEERLATFDSDGTLLVEYPRTLEELFVHHTLGMRLPKRARKLPFPIPKPLQGFGHLVAAWPFRGNTPAEYRAKVGLFLGRFEHPLLHRRLDSLVYRPMLELLRFLEANGFTTAVVSASGVSFVRAFAGQLYGIGLDQVVGTTVAYHVKMRDGRLRAERGRLLIGGVTTEWRKPSHLMQRFGRMPVFHAGNSDGDLEMFQIATSSGRPGMALVLAHDDARREFAYTGDGADKTDIVPVARSRGWTVASIARDWREVFPDDAPPSEEPRT